MQTRTEFYGSKPEVAINYMEDNGWSVRLIEATPTGYFVVYERPQP